MMWTAPYEKPWHGKGSVLVTLIRKRGQRWCRVICFGTKRHYRADGTCVHTDAVLERLTPYGQKVTKVQPWGAAAQ